MLNLITYASLPSKEQKKFIVQCAQNYYAENKRSPSLREFEEAGIPRTFFRKNFGDFQSFLNSSNLPIKQRPVNQTNDSLKEYLLSIKTVSMDICPSFEKVNTICYKKCNCWLTTKYPIDPVENRQKIFFDGKTVRLHQLSFILFKGAPPADKIIGHLCDNSLCYNPDHLEAITYKENAQQREQRGNGNHFNTKEGRHSLTNPYAYTDLLDLAKSRSKITEKGEWLYTWKLPPHGYPIITISKKRYYFHRLILANKLGLLYEEIDTARHLLPDGTEAQKNDLNPDHLFNGDAKTNALDRKNSWQLSEEKVAFVRDELLKVKFVKQGDAGDFDKKISIILGTTPSVISNIRLSKHYTVYFNEEPPKKGTVGIPVVQLSLSYDYVATFPSAKEAARRLNISASGITTTCNSKLNKSGGFIWIFEHDYLEIIGTEQ